MGRSFHVARAVALVFALAAGQVAATPAFDLVAYRALAGSDRAAGISEGRRALDDGVFRDDPAGERTLLWYMGGAAVGMPDDVALGEVVLRLDGLATAAKDPVAAHYAGFLRGARLIDQGEPGAGLQQVLEASNALQTHPDRVQRIIALGELCRAYINADKAGQALRHCRNHTRTVRETGDEPALARAEYMEAGALSLSGQFDASIPLWENARRRFEKAGLPALAGRASGSLAGDLSEVHRYEDAIVAARAAITAAEAAGNPISVHIARGKVAQALRHLQRYDEALAEIAVAIDGMASIDHPGVLSELLEVEAEIREARGGEPDVVAALRARLATLEMSEMVDAEDEAVTDLEERFRDREQALRIRELENENRRRELELEASREDARRQQDALSGQRLVTTLVVLAATGLLVGLGALVLLLRTQRRLAANLHEQAYRDALTALPNRRALLERLPALVSTPDAATRGHALLMVDIDHFKRFNDRAGHAFGDRVLAEVGACLQAHVCDGGTVARLGGEEFVVLCPDIGRDGALQQAERLRRAVSALDVRIENVPEPVTISLGVALFDGSRCRDGSTWLGCADEAVYRAKQNGRDRVEV